MGFETLRDLYVDHIQDLYSSEAQILDALPKMIDKASHVRLRDAFQQHLEQTRQHAARLEQIARRLNEAPHGKTCRGMAGVLKEGEEVIKEGGDQDVLDAAIIAAAQRVEHYEIAAYGCARTFAQADSDHDEQRDAGRQPADRGELARSHEALSALPGLQPHGLANHDHHQTADQRRRADDRQGERKPGPPLCHRAQPHCPTIACRARAIGVF